VRRRRKERRRGRNIPAAENGLLHTVDSRNLSTKGEEERKPTEEENEDGENDETPG
jgi:hypothetical protein